jgi:L-asparaginase
MTRLPRRVRRAAWPPQFIQAPETRASLRRSHRWSYVPHRGGAHRARPLARPYRLDGRRVRRSHAVLRTDTKRGGAQSERLAGPRPPDRTIGSRQLTTRRRAECLVASLTLLSAIAFAFPAWAQPRVQLIATGGTIANRATGRLTGPELVSQAAGVDHVARVEAETFARGPSLSLTLADWLRLARRVSDVLAATPEVAGVVITGGTDTLEELAWFLDLTIRSERPVVLTGAIRRPGTVDADGPQNLLGAVRVAASPAARGRGTLVVFNGSVFEARDVEKVSTASPDAFGSRGSGPVGRVGEDGVIFSRDVTSRHGVGSEFDLTRIATLPRVDVLLTYQDAPGDLIAAAIRSGARGIVVATAGAGALAEAEARAVEDALARGVPVVLASRVPGGSVSAEDVAVVKGLIAAADLGPLKARVLLMLALSQRLRAPELVRVFREY